MYIIDVNKFFKPILDMVLHHVDRLDFYWLSVWSESLKPLEGGINLLSALTGVGA